MMKKLWLLVILFVSIGLNLFFIVYSIFFSAKDGNEGKFLIVNKMEQELCLYSKNGILIKKFVVSTGEKPGNKTKSGDLKTPEGVFPIINIENSSEWSYDFKDGNGKIKGAYGPLFLRLNVDKSNVFKNVGVELNLNEENEFKGIGIHGTHDNSKIGSRASHGCIRMKNNDLLELSSHIYIGMSVIIIPSEQDMMENKNITKHNSKKTS